MTARSAVLTVELEFTISAYATEGEMVDAVQLALARMEKPLPLLRNGGSEKRRIVSTRIVTTGTGGSL